MHRNQRRQRQLRDLTATAQWITFALNNERGTGEGLEVRGTKLFGLAWRMEGVAETDEADDPALIEEFACHEACDTATHRFAADDEALTAGHSFRYAAHGFDILISEHFRFRRRTAFASRAPCRHVGKLEPADRNPSPGQKRGNSSHEGAGHGGTGSMRQQETRGGTGRTIFDQLDHVPITEDALAKDKRGLLQKMSGLSPHFRRWLG
jgi:hypothetical protein